MDDILIKKIVIAVIEQLNKKKSNSLFVLADNNYLKGTLEANG